MLISYRFRLFIIILLVIWTFSLIYFWMIPNDNSSVTIETLKNKLSSLQNKYEKLASKANIIKFYNELLHDCNNQTKSTPDTNMEKIYLSRRINSDLQELEFLIRNKPQETNNILDAILTLQARSDLLIEDPTDSEWRKKELKRLEKILQYRLHKLQNPNDCHNARKLICGINKGCGFGCQIHHITYCFIVAYALERTLVLDTMAWRYGGDWRNVFKPISDTCVVYDRAQPSFEWKGADTNYNIVNLHLTIVDTLIKQPKFIPQAIPDDLYASLSRVHSDPFVWFMGQMVSYITRLNNDMTKKIMQANNNKYMEIPTMGPIVGVHIRRTDKIGTEASFHSLDEYMAAAEKYFKKEELKANFRVLLKNYAYNKGPYKHEPLTLKRQIVLATDEPNLFDEIRTKYPSYEVIGNVENSKTADLANRYGRSGLESIIIDVMFLSQTSFLVCTFSSQICRLAYEIMQTKITTSPSGDQGFKFRSLDDIYYFGGQLGNKMIIIERHTVPGTNTILNPGDLVVIRGNHWNGYSRGEINDVDCFFPTYKAQFLHIITKMGSYSENKELLNMELE